MKALKSETFENVLSSFCLGNIEKGGEPYRGNFQFLSFYLSLLSEYENCYILLVLITNTFVSYMLYEISSFKIW